MSVAVMGLVWRAALPPRERLLALALADWADDTGGSIFASVDTQAAKCGLSRRATQRLLEWLRGAHILTAIGRRMPDGRIVSGAVVGRGQTVAYQLELEVLRKLEKKGANNDALTQRVSLLTTKGATSDTKGCQFTHVKGAPVGAVSVSRTVREPSGNRQEARKRPTRRLPETYTLIPDRTAEALKASLAADRIPSEWEKFADYEFRTPHSDWPAAWRNWCRTAVERGGGTPALPAKRYRQLSMANFPKDPA